MQLIWHHLLYLLHINSHFLINHCIIISCQNQTNRVRRFHNVQVYKYKNWTDTVWWNEARGSTVKMPDWSTLNVGLWEGDSEVVGLGQLVIVHFDESGYGVVDGGQLDEGHLAVLTGNRNTIFIKVLIPAPICQRAEKWQIRLNAVGVHEEYVNMFNVNNNKQYYISTIHEKQINEERSIRSTKDVEKEGIRRKGVLGRLDRLVCMILDAATCDKPTPAVKWHN